MMIKYFTTYILILLLSISLINCSRVDRVDSFDSGSNNNNNSIITAFLVPHSHCDLGWVQTLEQYYTENVTLILDNVIGVLIKDPTKKFNWAETYYFQAWWNEQSSIVQSQVRNLVYNKQLYFIGGGWAQNDEAVTHYQAVINQMTLGHQFLLSEFSFVPEIGWQIDPFGPSTLTATFFSLMGFKYHVINRIDERIKYQFFNPNITGSGWMTTDKSFEFIWYPSQSDSKISIFTHVLDHHYNSPYLIYPNATNPNISITTGFDFESDPIINPPINDTNIHERAAVLVEIIKQRSALFRHNNLLLPFGNDFRYQNASLEFNNMDKLIEYINSNSSNWGVYIQYATLNEYFEKVEKDTNSSNSGGSFSSDNHDYDHFYQDDATETSQPITFPEIVGQDLLVYTMCLSTDYQNFNTCANWWSGYYTSYPLLKQTIRDSDSLLRVGEMLYSLSSSYSNGYDFDFDVGFYALDFHRNVSGILTHHDAVTGTAKSFVRDDYFNMLNEAQTLTSNYNVPDLVGYLLSNKSLNRDYTSDNSTLVDAVEGDIIAVSFSNSLAWDRIEHVSLEVPLLNIAVYDYQLTAVASQVVQRFDKDGKWYLHISIATPALGISTYFIVILSSNGELTIENQYLPTPIPSTITECTKIVKDELSTGNTVSIGNSLFNLNFEFDSSNSNLLTLKSFDDLVKNQFSIPIKQHLIEYTSLSDDAYKFRVQGVPVPLKPENPQFYLTSGPIVQIVTIVYNSNCSQSYLVYNDTTTNNNPFSNEYNYFDSNNTTMIREDQYFEIDNTVAAGWDKEISILFSTSIENGNTFFTNNGLEMMKREWEIHWNDTFIWSEITGNFYPVVNTGYISDNEKQLTILTKQSVGASSQTNGDFELLLIRRSNYTQWSVKQPMNDTSNPSIRIRCFLSDPINSNTIRTPHSILFENPLQPVFAKVDYPLEKYIDIYNTLFKPLTNSFPYNLHLVTFTKQWIDSQSIIMRLLNIYELNQNQFFSKPVNLSMNNFLTHYNISQISETTLSANTVLSKHNSGDDLTITLEPLQLKTYLLTLNSKQQ